MNRFDIALKKPCIVDGEILDTPDKRRWFHTRELYKDKLRNRFTHTNYFCPVCVDYFLVITEDSKRLECPNCNQIYDMNSELLKDAKR